MFDISSLQYNAENPNLITVIYTVVSALGLGILIAFTYAHTTDEESKHNHFIQAIILVTIVAATIIQAIGDSVARGLGMLGALSIIRFRTTVKDPRNIVFIFSAIAAGIACGVFGFLIAFVGTLALCLTAFLLKFTAPIGSEKLRGTMELELAASTSIEDKSLMKVIQSTTDSAKLMRKQLITKGKKENVTTYRYQFAITDKHSLESISKALSSVEGITVNRLVLDDMTLMEM